MAIKFHRPTSAGRRFYTTSSYEEITKFEPEKSLLAKKDKHPLPLIAVKRGINREARVALFVLALLGAI